MHNEKWHTYNDLERVPESLNEYLTHSYHGSLFQSPRWVREVKCPSKPPIVLYAAIDGQPVFGALVLRSLIPGTRYFFGMVVRGPVFESLDAALSCWDELERQLEAAGAIGLQVNPYWERSEARSLESCLHGKGYRAPKKDFGHSETLSIDLRQTEEEIFAGSVSSKTRNMIRKGLSYGITARGAENRQEIEALFQLHDAMRKRKGIGGPSRSEFERMASFAKNNQSDVSCIVAWLDQKPIGGCVCLRHGERVTYTWGASTLDPMKGIPKTEIALWQSILWARQSGAAIFDLGGVTPDAEEGSAAWGINQFKKGFSRNRVELLRPAKKIFKPVAYRTYRLLKNTRQRLFSKKSES